jgi:hypothetical protein
VRWDDVPAVKQETRDWASTEGLLLMDQIVTRQGAQASDKGPIKVTKDEYRPSIQELMNPFGPRSFGNTQFKTNWPTGSPAFLPQKQATTTPPDLTAPVKVIPVPKGKK